MRALWHCLHRWGWRRLWRLQGWLIRNDAGGAACDAVTWCTVWWIGMGPERYDK